MQPTDSREPAQLAEQIGRIREAMIYAGVWSSEIPTWFNAQTPCPVPNLWQWLQYIYLPMRLHHSWYKPHYIAPVVSPYLNTTPELKRIIQLVIELDSISPTFEKN